MLKFGRSSPIPNFILFDSPLFYKVFSLWKCATVPFSRILGYDFPLHLRHPLRGTVTVRNSGRSYSPSKKRPCNYSIFYHIIPHWHRFFNSSFPNYQLFSENFLEIFALTYPPTIFRDSFYRSPILKSSDNPSKNA